MRKLFTLSVLLVLALAVNAENRKWDFTNWSSATVANLAADAQANGGSRWTTVEKANGDGETNGNCYWFVPEEETELSTLVNGASTPIAETQGLVFNCSGRSLALAINYQTAWDGMGPFAGSQYLWMGGKSNKFTIKNVKPGATITMEVESHRLTDGRGVSLTVNGQHIDIKEGSETPKEKTKCVWQIPADISATNVDVVVTNSNGCHIYYIDLVEDAPELDGTKIAYLFDSNYSKGYSADEDVMRTGIINNENDEYRNSVITDLDLSGDGANVSRDSLINYDVVVVSSAIDATNPYVATLKSALGYVPMVNFNAGLYQAWGYGEAVTTASGTTVVAEGFRDNELFKPLDPSATSTVGADGSVLLLNTGLVGVKYPEGSYFASDAVVASTDDIATIHIHNSGRNQYIYLPYPYEDVNTSYNEENIVDIVTNAIKQCNFTKTAITKAATPTFTETYKNMNTDVTIACGTEGAKIYYTLDGSTPTDASTLYTAPVNVTSENVTIKAVAYADGYDPSEVGSFAVSLYETSAVPTITTEETDTATIVTITSNEPGAALYYNFDGNNSITESTPYTVPVELRYPATIYAFAGEVSGKLVSEAVAYDVKVKGKEERLEVVSHFDANTADWSMGESKTKYYTEGKKNGYPYYSVTSHVETLPDGNDTIIVDSKEPLWTLTEVNPGKGWSARTYGQGMLWERITISKDIDDANTESRYRGDTSFDQGASANSVSFGNVQKSDGVENDPYSCFIMSTEAFQGPFDIVTYIGNGSSTNHPKASIWVSTDTTSTDNWVMIDSVFAGSKQRFIKKNILSYEGTDKVFVKLQAEFSSVMVMDIKIMKAGEADGILNVNEADEAAGEVVSTQVYSINGTLLAAPAKGINIIKEVYANGKVKTRKIVVR